MFLFDIIRWGAWQTWFDAHGVRLASILVTLIVLNWFLRRVLRGVIRRAMIRANESGRLERVMAQRRAETLIATLYWVVGLLLIFLGAGLVLAELGLNVSAFIAGIGVVGIALGLGAQTLVKDVINGLFILAENQYAVGDQVTVGGATGEVIEITPRRTVLRDGDGNIHVVPNSAITVAVNRTASLGRLRVDLHAPFHESDRVARIADEVAASVAEGHGSDVIATPRVMLQEAAKNGEVRIQLVGDVDPVRRWTVEADLRRRLRRRFDEEHVAVEFGTERDEKGA